MSGVPSIWPGWKASATRRALPWVVLASVVAPWLVGEFVKTWHQPGIDNDAMRQQMLIDFVVAGTVIFLLTMVLTGLIAGWIGAVMRGPRRDGDAFPSGQGRPRHDD